MMRALAFRYTAPVLHGRAWIISSMLALCVFEAAAPAVAQTPAAPVAPAADAKSPVATPSEDAAGPAQSDAAAAPAPAATDAAATTPPAQPAAAQAAPDAPDTSAEQQRAAGRAQLERERMRIAADLAWRKAQSRKSFYPGQEGGTAEPAQAVQHGDAGAPFAIGLSYEQPWYKDAGYNVFSEDDVGHRFGVWAAYDVAALREDTFLAIEAGFGTEHAEDSGLLGGALSSELSTKTVDAGLQLRWVPVSWLQPHARVAGGLAIVDYSVDARQHFKDDGMSPFGSFGLGFTLRTPTRMFEDRSGKLAALSVGLMLEGGYTLAKPLDFDLGGPTHSTQAIPISDAKAGRLDRSGPYARASIVVRF
jgi:hypothetical protein